MTSTQRLYRAMHRQLPPIIGAAALIGAASPAIAQQGTSQAADTAQTDGDMRPAGTAAAPTPRVATPADPDTGRDIVVTGSRTVTNGAAAPTPVTVVSAAQLLSAQPGNLADAVNQIPVLRGSQRPSSAGAAFGTSGAGANLLALRGLGPFRTLLLLDGHRVAPTTLYGTTDANLVPQGLVSRLDVVTGGASAAYGSDALAGVVNFVLDSRFEGVKANIQGGVSSRGDAPTMKGSLTVGHGFADDTVHILFNVDHFRQQGINLDYNGRAWAEAGWGIIGQSTTSALQVIAPDVRDSNGTRGGLIVGCRTASAAVTCPASLLNRQFASNRALVAFNRGQYVTAGLMSGGDGTARRTNLLPELQSTNLYGRIAWEATPGVTVYAEGLYGTLHSDYLATLETFNIGANAFTVYSDNAFLPAAVRTAMQQAGVASFTLGRNSIEVGPTHDVNDTTTRRIVGGIDAALGGGWKASAYAQYGRASVRYTQTNAQIVRNMYNGADAVFDARGNIVCRSTLLGTAAGPGCVPINLFGEGAISQEARAYAMADGVLDIRSSQLVVAGDIRGDLFHLWSDPVAIAFGGEYRRERGVQTDDPITSSVRSGAGIRGFPAAQEGQAGGFIASLGGPFGGGFNVKEGFVEINAPIVKDMPFLSRLDLNAGARYADYSTVGGKTTWKVGAIWEPVDGVRFRGTRSRDIRAPSIFELYNAANLLPNLAVNDPQNNGARVVVTQRQTGNPDLDAEVADSLTLGLVLRPTFLRGLTLSVDYFNIDIDKVIAQPTLQQVVNDCGTSCALVRRNPDGTLNVVTTPNLNIGRLKTNGEDYEIGYNAPLAGGRFGLRVFATHTRKLTINNGTTTIDRVGDLNVTPSFFPSGTPAWAGSGSIDWRDERIHLFVQERYIGPGGLDETIAFAPGVDTRVPRVFYTDATIGYTLPTARGQFELYGTINNVLDQDPPIAPNGATNVPRASNGGIYDLIGRTFTFGARVRF